MLNFTYNDQSYINWTSEEALLAGIPQETVDAAVLAASRAAMHCTPRQARLALAAEGLLDDVTDWVATQDQATQLTWEYATVIQRTDPIIAVAGTALSLSDADLDDIFTAAAAL
jgi:hypothetical protein